MLSKLLKGQPKKSALSISIHPLKDSFRLITNIFEMEVDYLNQLYFWEQPSYVERPFRKICGTEQNTTSFRRTPTPNQHNAVVLLRY